MVLFVGAEVMFLAGILSAWLVLSTARGAEPLAGINAVPTSEWTALCIAFAGSVLIVCIPIHRVWTVVILEGLLLIAVRAAILTGASGGVEVSAWAGQNAFHWILGTTQMAHVLATIVIILLAHSGSIHGSNRTLRLFASVLLHIATFIGLVSAFVLSTYYP